MVYLTNSYYGDRGTNAKTDRGGDKGNSVAEVEALIEPFDQLGLGNQIRP